MGGRPRERPSPGPAAALPRWNPVGEVLGEEVMWQVPPWGPLMFISFP